MSLGKNNFQIYNQAMDLKQEIEKHNAGVKELSNLHQQLGLNPGKKFDYDTIRIQSDFQKLNDIQSLQDQQLTAQKEQSNINQKLDQYLGNISGDNANYIDKLNEKITDRNQIININQRYYDKKDLYTSLLTTLMSVLVGILMLSVIFTLGAITRESYVILLVVGLIGYLIYVLYLLIKVRYFRDPDFTVYRNTIDSNIGVQDCGCDSDNGLDGLTGNRGSKFVCPGMK